MNSDEQSNQSVRCQMIDDFGKRCILEQGHYSIHLIERRNNNE